MIRSKAIQLEMNEKIGIQNIFTNLEKWHAERKDVQKLIINNQNITDTLNE